MHHARETIRKAGYRLTPQRVAVWETVRRGGRHRTAEEIAAEVQQTLPEVNVSTVYRTLELLVGLELVQETRLAGIATYYEVAPSPVHHHFVCEELRRGRPPRRRAARARAARAARRGRLSGERGAHDRVRPLPRLPGPAEATPD